MEQTHIYDYLGEKNDPIFNKISGLKSGQVVDLGGVIISLNQRGIYELETSYHHECFKTKKQLYDGVSKFLSLIVL